MADEVTIRLPYNKLKLDISIASRTSKKQELVGSLSSVACVISETIE